MLSSKKFQRAILTWFDHYGRKDLPWQKNKSPYRVWVSEIMLQQTQVKTVIPFFQRFMQNFPDIYSLAKAQEDEVLHLWTGLGYYSRARNLHRSAKMIVENYNGFFPDEVAELQKLPGIGRSTAAAILAIAFEKKAAILDGNVKRVLVRLHHIQEWPGEKKVIDTLWQLAEKYAPTHRIADYTQALMDLGATVCTRGKPHCETCPLQKNCQAHAEGNEIRLPKPKPKKILPIRKKIFLLLQDRHFIFLEKRSSIGIWGGLWSLPETDENTSMEQIHFLCKEKFNCTVLKTQSLNSFRHTFTHFHLDIFPLILTVKKISSKIKESSQELWFNLKEPAVVGLPAPVKFLLLNL